ncbi:MAG: FtsX-like permease family protein [Bacteroidetes bacterium]|nr:FtsX-like permease family protein [Bacteroidota bacterium]
MNLPYFIAKKVAFSNRQSFTGLIVRIAIVAVALSLAVMIVSTAVISGFKHQIGEKIFGFWGHIHITSTQINRTTGESVPISIHQQFYPSLDTLGKITYTESSELFGWELPWQADRKTKGGIRHIQVFALKPGIIKTKKEIEGIVLKGIGNDFDWSFFDKFLVEGSRLELPDSLQDGIVLSKQTATRLELGVGDKFIFYYVRDGEALAKRFTVTGIYKTGLEEYDRKFALVDIRNVQALLDWAPDMVGGFEVSVDDLSDMEVFSDYIYMEVLPAELYCESIRKKYPAIFDWLALQDINEVVILALMLVVGLINMVTALMILILERTNMIGVLKSLGQTDWGIRKVFLYNAAYIILLGLFFGNLAGISFCILQEKYGLIQLSEENYYLSVAPIELDFISVLALNIASLFVILLFLILPSWLVTRISPVKAIRFK